MQIWMTFSKDPWKLEKLTSGRFLKWIDFSTVSNVIYEFGKFLCNVSLVFLMRANIRDYEMVVFVGGVFEILKFSVDFLNFQKV